MSNQDSAALFKSALEKISTEKYHEAKADLLEIKSLGQSSAPIEYNLAKTYFETNEIGFSLFHLNNAVHLNRWDFDYRRELHSLEKEVPSQAGIPMSHPAEIAFDIGTFIRPVESFYLASIFLIGFLFLKFYRKSKALYALSLVLCIGFVFTGLFTWWGNKIAIVKVESKLKEAPLESSKTVRPLSAGTRVLILKERGKFVEIERAKSAIRGWVEKESLVKIN